MRQRMFYEEKQIYLIADPKQISCLHLQIERYPLCSFSYCVLLFFTASACFEQDLFCGEVL